MDSARIAIRERKRLPSPTPATGQDRDREEEGKRLPTPAHLDQGNGKCQSDRGQVIGRKLLIGQLAPWVTWDI
jgi:hypothetical protein